MTERLLTGARTVAHFVIRRTASLCTPREARTAFGEIEPKAPSPRSLVAPGVGE